MNKRKFYTTWTYKFYEFFWNLNLFLGKDPYDSKMCKYIYDNHIEGKWGPSPLVK